MVDLRAGDATAPRLFAFAIGEALAFAAVEAVASAGFEIVIHEERSDVMLVGTSLAPIAVSLGLGAAYAVTTALQGAWAWLVVPLVATVVYVVAAGVQLTVARRHQERHPPDEEE